MRHGGHRENAGRKTNWIHTETKTIRVPAVLAKVLLEIAHILDAGGEVSITNSSKHKTKKAKKSHDSVTKSKGSTAASDEICPRCGAEDWTICGYRELKSGERKQKRRCKECDRSWSASLR